MSLKSKSVLQKIKVRPGDIVFHKGRHSKEYGGREYSHGYGVVGVINGWWQLTDLVDVHFGGMGNYATLTEFKNLKVVRKREEVKAWWKLFETRDEKEFQKLLKKL